MGMMIFSGLAYVSEKDEEGTMFISMPQVYTDKKENQILLIYVRKFIMEQLQSHIWIRPPHAMGKYLRISSYIRKPFFIYDFATAPL